MANYCKHCGRKVEAPVRAHAECAALAAEGLTDLQITRKMHGLPELKERPSKPVTAGGVFFAVLAALLVFVAIIVAFSALAS